jgi:hypothetical protein
LKAYSQNLIDAGVIGKVKIVPIPLAKNKVMYRLENINDFESAQVNNTLIIESMWKAANPSVEIPSEYKLTETSVTGNMPISEMQDRRLKWISDMPEHFINSTPIDEDGIVNLIPMQIRVFVADFN